ncbi:SH3 domain-containing protein [Streptomyces sp. NPDC059009]|uniref:SH3 domain-containing protein n=1 Tax=Streptomyces sp. NPDC059009 TaxID=3346694 RepID=UPI0036C93656
MRTTPALTTLAAALLAGGALTVATAPQASAHEATHEVTHEAAHSVAHNNDGVVWGTVVSASDLNVRDQPSTGGAIVATLPSGSQDRVECATRGSSVWGNPYWYWLGGARGWVSAAYVDTAGRGVPDCGGNGGSSPCHQWHDNCNDPCPVWKDR